MPNSYTVTIPESLEVTSSGEAPTVEISANLVSDQTVNLAGQYTDTLTFTVSVDNAD